MPFNITVTKLYKITDATIDSDTAVDQIIAGTIKPISTNLTTQLMSVSPTPTVLRVPAGPAVRTPAQGTPVASAATNTPTT